MHEGEDGEGGVRDKVPDWCGVCRAGMRPASTTDSRFSRPPLSPLAALRTRTVHSTRWRVHVRTHTKCLCPTPSPWGGGPSNTDVALINWAQQREVGLETTWQFPAASPSTAPHPTRYLHPSRSLPSASYLDHVRRQVGCWEVCLPCGVDILPASSSLGALYCRHSLWQCLPWLWAECWNC